jgi:hypothetical protein
MRFTNNALTDYDIYEGIRQADINIGVAKNIKITGKCNTTPRLIP